jgi:hypothetical protein
VGEVIELGNEDRASMGLDTAPEIGADRIDGVEAGLFPPDLEAIDRVGLLQ